MSIGRRWIRKLWYIYTMEYSVQFSSVTQSCPTLCNPMNHSTPGLPVHHQLLEFTQTHVHQVSDAIQPSHPLRPLFLPPHPIPQGHPSAPALSALSHASNLDWRFISHIVICMSQCYLSNHPTLAFSHGVQKSVLYVCVSFAVSHIGSSLPSF